MEIPDRWVVLEINSIEHGKILKVFAGWYGGFTTGDSWQMNSGIDKAVEHESHYDFYGYSGSIYRCSKCSYGMSGYMATVLESLKRSLPEGSSVSIVEGFDNC